MKRPNLSRTRQIAIAVIAVGVLMTGVLNLRSAIGGDGGSWEADPSARSGVDQLIGAPGRLPTDLDQQIVSLQDDLRAHPSNGESATTLGLAYLQKVRETGDPSYYPKAQELFEKAIKANDQDFAAAAGLGQLDLARHHFGDALKWGNRSAEINPYYPSAYGVIGDALVELGQYDEAIATIQKMVDLRPDLSSYARVSYIRELMGDVPGAIDAMRMAANAGAGRAENVAWTHVQLGNLRFNSGDLSGAESEYELSLEALDNYVYGTAGLARVATARGEFPAAIELYRRAIEQIPLPEFVIALGEVYQAAGMTAEADKEFALVDAMITLYAANGVDTDVELALFEADHGGDPDSAVKIARAGYEKRPSVKAADVLGWALYRDGKFDEARTYSEEALRLGTEDPVFKFHAGMIALALGDDEGARSYLQTALDLNPAFSPLFAPMARKILDTPSVVTG